MASATPLAADLDRGVPGAATSGARVACVSGLSGPKGLSGCPRVDARASDRRRQRRGQAGHRQAGHRRAVRRRRYPSLLPAALLGLAASVPRPASAAELTASGPAACPDVAELSFRVERAIGMPLAHAAPLRFDVRFAGEAAAFTARLAVEPSDLSAPRSERMRRSSLMHGLQMLWHLKSSIAPMATRLAEISLEGCRGS